MVYNYGIYLDLYNIVGILPSQLSCLGSSVEDHSSREAKKSLKICSPAGVFACSTFCCIVGYGLFTFFVRYAYAAKCVGEARENPADGPLNVNVALVSFPDPHVRPPAREGLGTSSRLTCSIVYPRGAELKMAEAPSPPTAAQGGSALETLPMADRPTCVICLGMAGSGKTTFVQVSHT